MNKDNAGKRVSYIPTILVTMVLTLVVAGGLAYFLGYLSPSDRAIDNPLGGGEVGGAPTVEGQAESILYSCGMHPWVISEEPGNCPICAMKLTPMRDQDAAAQADTKKERKILYWRAPMDPMEIYDKPGKSKMGMDLVPVYEDEVVGGVEIKIDPVTQQNMGIRTARVERLPLVHTIRTYGNITYDETTTTELSPKFSGWIEKLYVDFTGQFVKKGDLMFDIYSPALVTAQEEYLVAHKTLSRVSNRGGKDLLEAARRRLLYWDVPEDEIHAIEKSGEVKKTLTIRSPFDGVVTHKNAVKGVFVKQGTTIYQIADLSQVWVEAHIYEFELPWVNVGQEAEMMLPYLPGEVFTGKVTYVYPYLQRKTRDVVIRLEFENPELDLRPDMFADVLIKSNVQGEGLVIASEAVIRSGERNVVFVTRGDGKFTPREVRLGLAMGGKVQVMTGLTQGETVVTSGQFLLDSESKLKEAVQKMMEDKMAAAKGPEEEDFFKDLGEEDDFFSDM
jgi:Cu(I)/Ag(I) efflux system membrane fusion protein/cobalt-zinc-cadmium efflux system membrane fusion protein